MPYIDTKYLFKCETCRNFRNNVCRTFCESGEGYSPNMSKIPTVDVVPSLVPPCKVGDMLYKPYCGKILEYKVIEFSFRVEGLQARTQSKQTGGLHPVWCASIGKTYFLHRHEAEAVLAALLKGGK